MKHAFTVHHHRTPPTGTGGGYEAFLLGCAFYLYCASQSHHSTPLTCTGGGYEACFWGAPCAGGPRHFGTPSRRHKSSYGRAAGPILCRKPAQVCVCLCVL
eukprot:117550-Pelagomonas_calceolata.AAC.1